MDRLVHVNFRGGWYGPMAPMSCLFRELHMDQWRLKFSKSFPRDWDWSIDSERPRSLLLSLGVPSRPSLASDPGPIQVPSRGRRGPVQICHVLCFTAFRTHPSPEVGAIPARPGPILVPSVLPGSGRNRLLGHFRLMCLPSRFKICRAILLRTCPPGRKSVRASGPKQEKNGPC